MFKFLLYFSLIFYSRPLLAATSTDWVKVEIGHSRQILHLTGRVVPQDGALSIISARVSGRVLSFLKKEGESVSVGTPIYKISSGECLSLVEEKRLAESRHIDDLVLAVDRREKQLGLRIDGDNCEAISNFSGIVIKRNLEIGTAFNAGDSLATIVNTQRLTVELEVPEGEIYKVKLANAVKVKIEGRSEIVKGFVDVIVPTVDTGTRTSKIRLKEIKSKNALSLDSLVSADLELSDSAAKVFSVPKTALVFHNDKQYIIKGNREFPIVVAVQILNELEDSALVAPLKVNDLSEKDFILGKGAIFIFNKIHEGQLK